jgi:cytochrome b6-f complex iron-sulfur subunit
MTELSVQTKRRDIPEEQSAGKTPLITTRRGLLKALYALFAAAGLGGLGYGIHRFLAPGGGAASPVEVPLAEIQPGGTVLFQYAGSPGILLQEEDGTFRAFSLVCTHLACNVVWKADRKEFYCPCHDGLFDAQGNVLSGPPPSPLERWPVQVKNDRIVIGA